MKIISMTTVLAFLLCMTSNVFAGDIEAVTKDGQKVILKENGTWNYYGADNTISDYREVKALLQDAIVLNEKYVEEIKKAENAVDVASAIDKYGTGLRVLLIKNKKMEKKYPFLKTLNKKNAPPELAKEMSRMDELTKEIISLSQTNLSKYMQDKDVLKAVRKLGTIMKEANTMK